MKSADFSFQTVDGATLHVYGWVIDKPKAMPFPLQWIPHTQDESQFEAADEARGFRFLDVVCCETGKDAPIGTGVLCLRCAVPLHPEAANMFGGFDPHYCNRCSSVIRWVG